MKNIFFSICFALATLGLSLAQDGTKKYDKTTFSLTIRPTQATVKAGSSVDVEVAKTNISDRQLNNSRTNNPGEYYSFDIRRDGVPALPTETLKRLRKPNEGIVPRMTSVIFGNLAPHETFKETVSVSSYWDMAQPGKYSIELHQGKVKSNTVTVTVVP